MLLLVAVADAILEVRVLADGDREPGVPAVILEFGRLENVFHDAVLTSVVEASDGHSALP